MIRYYTDRLAEENRQLKRQIEMYESQDAIREMKDLCDKRIRSAQDREKRQHDGWMNCLEANKELKKRNSALWKEKEEYRGKLRSSLCRQEGMESALQREKHRREQVEEKLEKKEEELTEKDTEIEALKEELCRLKARLDHDGTTNGIPTSQTPRDKRKVIPNAREKSDRKRGGQAGHEKHSMKDFGADEITETEEHGLEKCPECGGDLEELPDTIDKDELDYEVKIIRKRHKFKKYRCKKCGKTVHAKIPGELKEKVQYGPETAALSLGLVDLGFVSVSRTKKFLDGFLPGGLSPSEGYIGKVQKKTAGRLEEFRRDVREKCLEERILHWDDTVVFMNTKRACFRFYGNEKLALYYAHESKKAEGLEQDDVLQRLTEKTSLMHDHLKYNYREEFQFRNLECTAHLERELQRVFNDSGHDWALKLKEQIGAMIHRRKELQAEGKEKFPADELRRFERQCEKYLAEGEKICEETENRYYHTDEKNALKKMREYRGNYFAWVYDFTLPTTNNEAESGLRMTKSKLKISGQFGSEGTADEFALVRTYTETCRRNGINEFKALKRLTGGNPYTLEEILA